LFVTPIDFQGLSVRPRLRSLCLAVAPGFSGDGWAVELCNPRRIGLLDWVTVPDVILLNGSDADIQQAVAIWLREAKVPGHGNVRGHSISIGIDCNDVGNARAAALLRIFARPRRDSARTGRVDNC